MKKTLLILYACLFGALSGVKAYTTSDLTAAGWTLVTNLDDIISNVYVFVDAGSSNYAFSGLTNSPGWKKEEPAYRTLANPFTTPYEVWTIESRNDGYALRNIESQKYFNSNDGGTGEGWLDHMADTYDNGSFTLNKDGLKYNFYGISSQGFVGPWNNDGAVASDGESIAANKGEGAHPDFFIYKMAKATYALKYLQQNPNLTSPVDVSYLIVNPTIYQGGAATDLPWGWNTFGNHDTDDNKYTEGTGNTTLRAHKKTSGNYTFDFDYYCAISNLPGGNYKVKTSGYGSPTRVKSYLYINNSNSAHKISQELSEGSPAKDYETAFLSVSTGESITLGVEAEGKHDAGGSSHTSEAFADDFRLTTDPYLSTMAAELPANGAMTAGLWYHFTVANTGNHILTATTLNDIIYATGNTTALSDAGSNEFSAIQSLTAGTDYYVRSSTDNTLTMKPCISTVAAVLPDNGEMTANDWYYFDIATASHYDFVANSLGNIVYTTEGDLAEDASVGNKFSIKDNDLSAARYYVKSSSAQTLQWFISCGTDLTSIIKNPSFETGDKTDWTDDSSTNDKFFVQNNADFSKKQGTYYAERYWWDNTSDINQTTPELPAGIYRITAAAMDDAASPTFKLYAKAGSSDEVTQTVGTADDYSVEVSLKTAGVIKLGFKGTHTHTQWAAVDNFRLTYVGPYNEVVDDEEAHIQTYEGTFTEDVEVKPTLACPFVDITGASFTDEIFVNRSQNHNGLIYATPAQIAMIKASMGKTVVDNVISNDGNVCENLVIEDGYPFFAPPSSNIHATEATYSRDINVASNFGTICLPYAVESNEDIQYYTTEEITDGGVLKLTEVASVAAGTPAIFKKASASATKITAAANDVALTRTAGQAGVEVKLVGTFEDITVGDKDSDTGVALNQYYIKNNEFCQGVDNFNVKAFRAYINSEINAGARLTVRTDEETAINELKTLDEKQGLKDGKYLIDGKVIVVKNGNQFNVNGVLK